MATLTKFPALAVNNLPTPHHLHRIHVHGQRWVLCSCNWAKEYFTDDPPAVCGFQEAEAERQALLAIVGERVAKEIAKGQRERERLHAVLDA